MTTQSPDQSVSQSNAPKALEQLIGSIAEQAEAHLPDSLARKLKVEKNVGMLYKLAAELGKEREADAERTRVEMSYISTINQLKRELAEARKVLSDIVPHHDELLGKYLALSAAYQRQKYALEECSEVFRKYAGIHLNKDTEEGDRKAHDNEQMANRCDAALAETPDVSILADFIEALNECAQVFDDIDAVTWNEDGCPIGYADCQKRVIELLKRLNVTTAKEAAALLSTLQPDHQK